MLFTVLLILLPVAGGLLPLQHGSNDEKFDKDANIDHQETWWIIADTHIGRGELPLQRLENAIEDVNDLGISDYAIVLGDLVHDDIDMVEAYENAMNKLDHEWEDVLGNHDFDTIDGMGVPVKNPTYFSREIGGIRFIFLSDEGRWDDGRVVSGYQTETNLTEKQNDWFRTELENNPDKPTIIMSHQALLRMYEIVDDEHHGNDEGPCFWDTNRRGWLQENIEEYNIIMWYHGHRHRWALEENYKGHGFVTISPGALADSYGGGIFMTVTVKDGITTISNRFRNHDREWQSVEGHFKYVYEVVLDAELEVEWEFSDRQGNLPEWFSENAYPRGGGFGIVDGEKRLVFPVRDGARFHDAEDGSHIQDLSMTGLKESFFDVNVADFTDDGKIIAAGLTLNNTGDYPFNVHMWNDPDSDPVNIISYDGGTGHRLGDQFNVAGSYEDGTAKVIAAAPGHPYIYVFSMEDGEFDDENPEIIEIEEEGLSGNIGSNANAYPVGDDQWLYNTNGIVPALLNADGTVAGNTAGGVVDELSNNIKVVKEDGDTFYYIVGLPNPDDGDTDQARLQSVRVPDGNMDEAETIAFTPSIGDVENRDERIAVDYHYDQEAGLLDFYVIEINNGIARFQTDPPTDIPYNTMFELALADDTYPDWLGDGTNERGMAAYDESVYIISRDGLNLLEVDSQNGELVNTTPVTGAEGGTFDLNDIGVSEDGVLYTANLTTNASSNAFRVYELDAATGEAAEVIVFEDDVIESEDGGRLGDKITVAGAKNDGSLTVYAGDQSNNRILTWEWNNNSQAFGEAKEIVLSEDITGSNVSVTPRSDGTFYWNAIGHYPRKFDGDGELIGVFPDEVVPAGSNALSYLGHDGEYDYLIIYLSAVDHGNLSLVRIPKDSVEGAEELSRTRPLRVTGSAGRGDVSFISRQNGDVDLFVLTSNNALAGYEYHIEGLSEIETSTREITSDADLPEEPELAQNYPNPFNPVTRIGFSLPEYTHVKLTVYDILGREVAVLVDEFRAAGYYHVNWDASRYASGVYVYRLQAGDQSITRRMTFIK